MTTELRIEIDRGDVPLEECGSCQMQGPLVCGTRGCWLFNQRCGTKSPEEAWGLRCRACLDAEVASC